MNSVFIKKYKEYLIAEKNLTLSTVEVYEREILYFYKYSEKVNLTEESFTLSDIEKFLTIRKKTLNSSEEGLKGATVNKSKSAVRSFCCFLQKEDIRKDNPSELIQSGGRGRSLPEVFDVYEIDAVLDAIDIDKTNGIRDRALFELIYSSGLRISEASDLKYSSIYFNEAVIRIFGKGRKERFVPLGDEAEKWLKNISLNQDPFFLKIKNVNIFSSTAAVKNFPEKVSGKDIENLQ